MPPQPTLPITSASVSDRPYARDTYLEYKFRHKNDLPIVTKKFSDVARLAIMDMRKQLDAGLGNRQRQARGS